MRVDPVEREIHHTGFRVAGDTISREGPGEVLRCSVIPEDTIKSCLRAVGAYLAGVGVSALGLDKPALNGIP
jgi:hypothetical protein